MSTEAAAIENIAVYARIRSSSQPAEASSDVSVVDGQPDKVRAKDLQFNLDHAFGSDAKQAEVFNVIGAPLVQRITDGYNACIIAYGQTGSGKTYTMLGPENAKLDGSGGETADLGIVPRACLQLFKMLPAGYTVTTSYMEVYNDNVNDLLTADYTNKEYLPLRETVPGHVEPDGITRRQVKSASDVMKAIALGDSRRVVAAMAMNPRSSRGHGLIAIETYTDKGMSHGRLCLVDLAGMESSKKSGAVDVSGPSAAKARQEEAKRINMSLLALSNVVNALASKGAMKVPFRDSKLTRLLQSSLAGNCKAAFVVMLRGEKQNVEEATLTLRFAQARRAKAVAATVMRNEDSVKARSTGAAFLAAQKKLEEELQAQRAALSAYQEKLASAEGVKEAMKAKVDTLLSEMQSLQRDADDAKRQRRQEALQDETVAMSQAALERRVKALEQRNRELEEENRLLRQRDIMHRLIELDQLEAASGDGVKGGLGVNKEQLATFNTPSMSVTGAFAVQLDRQIEESEVRREPTKKVLSREDQATIKIQAVWRGKMVRDELAFGYGDEHAYGY